MTNDQQMTIDALNDLTERLEGRRPYTGAASMFAGKLDIFSNAYPGSAAQESDLRYALNILKKAKISCKLFGDACIATI